MDRIDKDRLLSLLAQNVAMIQGGYFALAGIWPILHLRSFLLVTGGKTDIWLVRTVGLLVFCIGVTLLMDALNRLPPRAFLGISTAVCLALVDLTYVGKGVISPIYLLDALIQVLIIAGWAASLILIPPVKMTVQTAPPVPASGTGDAGSPLAGD